MKKLLFCIGMFIFAASCSMAQSVIDADETHNFNDFYKKDLVKGKQAMPHEHVRGTDVVWEHVVWRTIDFREKFNQFFYFPTDPNRNTQGRVNLANALMEALRNGDIEVFKEDDLVTPYTYEEMMKQLTRTYTFHISEYDDWGDETEGRDTLIHEEFQPSEVYSCRIKESWYIDKEDTRQKVRILGLTLVYNYCKDREGERQCDPVEMFWVPMDDMRVRNALVKVLAYDEDNAHSIRSYDDIFIERFFDSFIYRESNTYGRDILSYLTGTDAILESQAIENKIFDIESDMWEY